MGALRMPPHVHVPGKTPRHDPALFADLLGSVRDGMTLQELTGTLAWQSAWAFLENGYFWEAHEALEPIWMTLPPNSAGRHLVQAAIQIANAELKHLMGRPNAVLRLCAIAQAHLDRCGPGDGQVMGIRLADLSGRVERIRARSGQSAM